MEPGSGPVVAGVKRKHPDDHRGPLEVEAKKESQEQAPSSRSNLGQTLLRLSMDKFQLRPQSLLRQVLITNTLNYIKEKMHLERTPAPPQEPRLELLLPLTAQSANNFLRELEVILGLRATQDEPPDPSWSPASAPDVSSDCRQIPPPLGASVCPSVRVEEPTLGSFETMSNRYLGDLVPDDFFPDIDTSDVERDPWPSPSALASSYGAVCSLEQPRAEWDWTELDQILEIIKGS
ncbi:SERTA domain-containing protein 3 isoform X2 [Phascolarctos cinereus]|uniref:SERTA domain-containing protein 3 isoform X2 n=1 Tax=Phascolarctos cinereus TaxID=38626 RepID=A0A6P5JTQ5_PHACI|nr:SERTA domain-containing protein 3 isoform X2 [Phascolarctos cinereus]